MSVFETKTAENVWKVYFLGWLDALEKLDILVLELRHLQTTCIHQIRMPIMLELLRKEDELLTLSKDDPTTGDFASALSLITSNDPLPEIKELINKWVPLFPPISTKKSEDAEDDLNVIKSQIAEAVSQCWHTGVWGDRRKDLYNFLTAAQRIKRQIFTDRLLLFIEGGRALGLFSDKESRTKRIHGKRT